MTDIQSADEQQAGADRVEVFDRDNVSVWEGTSAEFGQHLELIRGGGLIDRDVVSAFLATLTETEAGPDDWPELAALYKALGFVDD